MGVQGNSDTSRAIAPALPQACLVVGVTGHRARHPSFPTSSAPLDAVIDALLDHIDDAVRQAEIPNGQACGCTTRLMTLLADGTDHHAATRALERGWDLVTPLPFGRALNAAINSDVASHEDAQAVLSGKAPSDAATAERVAAIEELAEKAQLFELADQDDAISSLLIASLGAEDQAQHSEKLKIACARRAAMAGRLMVEQSDVLVAVWDGRSVDSVGGTGHTVAAALAVGVPVVWINPEQPDSWSLYQTAEELASAGPPGGGDPVAALKEHIAGNLSLEAPTSKGRFAGIAAIGQECWKPSSRFYVHPYRRIEALFGATRFADRFRSLRQEYERPERIAEGSHKSLLDDIGELPGQDPALVGKIEQEVLHRFAWTDGIGAWMADRYRSGMVVNFLLGAAAIIVGTLYLPLVEAEQKWMFALVELVFLLLIIANTVRGQKRRFHGRWFETRRAAEYLRHSPYLLTLGVARAVGRWPHGVNNWWPEWYVRHILSGIGLPAVKVDTGYLRGALALLRDHHIVPQREYHEEKSERLERVHHQLDKLSDFSFAAAVLVVTGYLIWVALAGLGMADGYALSKLAKWFTVAAVAFPTIGGAIAAIRYFADFERFAEISKMTAAQLSDVGERVDALLLAPDEQLDFARVARIFHDTDDIVFTEIQNWQAVFRDKRTTIPA